MKRWLAPITRFLQIESASGIILLACAIAALILANSPWAAGFAAFWQQPFGFSLGQFNFHKPLVLWVNDGLMTLFFFVIGLEIKRELLFGELNDKAKAMLPAVASLGGMIVPAFVYLAFLWGKESAGGWGIPMATDIAFAVGFLALLGSRVPHSLKILLLALAIVDDIGATLVIALVYTENLSWPALAVGFAGFGVVALLRRIDVRQIPVYAVVGVAIWFAFLKSGVHPTVAGVILGLMTPARAPGSPLERLEAVLHPWVAFLIMPLFALANAGVAVRAGALGETLTLAVAAGLVVGKPIGVVAFSWLAERAGYVRLPTGTNYAMLVGIGCLAGVGFTMSLFIANLALHDAHLDQAKLGIMAGSAISTLIGCALLWRFLPDQNRSVTSKP
jgi:NhaA family Na+:H+ antiporter